MMKVGVVGAGAISDIYLQNMIRRFDNLEVISVCARHMERARAKAEKYQIEACTLEEMAADPRIEMIVNLTPVGAHESIIRRALEGGKHVYTEKTLTDRLETAAGLRRLAAEKGLYLGSAPDTFLGAALQTARDAIDRGLLGDIHSFAVSATRNNSLLLSMFPFLREPGAGILFDYAVYYITALVSLLGPAAQAGGLTGTPYPTHQGVLKDRPDYGKTFASPNESQVNAVIRLSSGVTGTVHIDSDTCSGDEAFFRIYGTKGVLQLTDPNQFGGDVILHPTNPLSWEAPEDVRLEPVSSLSDNCRGIGPSEMAEAIAEGRVNRASAEMAYHVMEILTAILESGREDGSLRTLRSRCERPMPMKGK